MLEKMLQRPGPICYILGVTPGFYLLPVPTTSKTDITSLFYVSILLLTKNIDYRFVHKASLSSNNTYIHLYIEHQYTHIDT